MKTLKFIVFLMLIIIIGSCTYVAVQPNNYEVVRTRIIDANSSLIYDTVLEYKTWATWSSWIEKKPNTKITYSEQTNGIGGSYSWEDDDGFGNMKTITAKSSTFIEQSMQFDNYEPSKVTWDFITTDKGKTKVSWTIRGDNVPFGFKLYALFSGGFDKMIGPDFQRGLEKLDSLVIESTKKHLVVVNGITEYGGGFYLYKTTNAKDSNISQKMAEQYGSIMTYVIQNNITMSGMPFTIYNEMKQENETVIMSNCIPINQNIEITKDNDISCGFMSNTKVLKTTLKGNYTYLSDAWDVAFKYVEDNNLILSQEKPFEIYTNDPGDFPNPADWTTEIYIPLVEDKI